MSETSQTQADDSGCVNHEYAVCPSSARIRAARVAAGLTQTEAGKLVHGTLRTWQNWEAGSRVMGAGIWELFCIKVKTITTSQERKEK